MSGVIAIAGCPNAGKTTLFNRLTGANQTVGNWPGQTVERHQSVIEVAGEEFELVDLPGIYGLVAVSAEESITTGFLGREQPAAVVTVIDATQLSSGLHLVQHLAQPGQLVQVDIRGRRRDDLDALRRLGAFPQGKHDFRWRRPERALIPQPRRQTLEEHLQPGCGGPVSVGRGAHFEDESPSILERDLVLASGNLRRSHLSISRPV